MSIIKATRAHYAALQHRPAIDREALDYTVTIGGNVLPGCNAPSDDCSGTVWVKTRVFITRHGTYSTQDRLRRAAMTRLMNRLRFMYPEARLIESKYRDKE